nr:DNA repair and recombination protein RAD54B isoform X3 [Anser cygnoides]
MRARRGEMSGACAARPAGGGGGRIERPGLRAVQPNMRRSAAPSQVLGNVAKKPRFIPPGKSNALRPKTETKEVDQDMKLKEVNEQQGSASGLSKIYCQNQNVNFTQSVDSTGKVKTTTACNSGNKCSRLEMKMLSTPKADAMYLPTSGTAKEEAAQEEPDCLTKYFSVVWCKASKKKHKKWEGDAVLVTKGKSVILKDMEGKDIGRGTGYKPKELDSLDEGQTLMIGGKEIEVMGVISADDFSSGRCFQTGIVTHDTVPTALPQASMKRFCKPFKNVCQPNTKENILNNSQSCKPRHDPNASNSLVMPRPNASHQWMFNKAGLPVVDVVVDPYIANNLRPHQKEGIVFLYECVMGMRVSGRFGAILADEMGLGKTLQCISLVWTLLRQGVYGCKPVLKRALIVTPGSLVKNWKKEFQKWLGSERIKVFTVDQDHKVEEFISSPLYSVMIISYEMLLRSLEQIQAIEFNLLICDEGHRLKNSSIKTTTALTSLSCERRIILTGTPIQNDLQEFYALIEFVNPGVLGSLSTYRKIYEEPIVRSREPSATKEKSCDPMNDEHDESSLYEGLTDVFPQGYSSDTFSETDSGKLQVLVKLLAAIHELNSSERVVLVSNYTQTLNILQETCKSYGYSYTRLDGHTPVSQRQHIVDSFNSKFSPAFIFLLSSKAGGVGLNLVGASHLILYDIDWNPATDIQAMARVWRDGQKHTVHIYRLLTTGSIEEKIYQRQISKQDLSGAVVDLSKTSEHIHFSVEELKNLFTLHEDSSCVTHDLLECDCMGNKDHQNPSSEKPSASRSCQLGQDQGKPNSKKPLSMSQLMQWKHFSGQHQALADPFLERIKEKVSFIFQNVTSPTSPAQ